MSLKHSPPSSFTPSGITIIFFSSTFKVIFSAKSLVMVAGIADYLSALTFSGKASPATISVLSGIITRRSEVQPLNAFLAISLNSESSSKTIFSKYLQSLNAYFPIFWRFSGR